MGSSRKGRRLVGRECDRRGWLVYAINAAERPWWRSARSIAKRAAALEARDTDAPRNTSCPWSATGPSGARRSATGCRLHIAPDHRLPSALLWRATFRRPGASSALSRIGNARRRRSDHRSCAGGHHASASAPSGAPSSRHGPPLHAPREPVVTTQPRAMLARAPLAQNKTGDPARGRPSGARVDQASASAACWALRLGRSKREDRSRRRPSRPWCLPDTLSRL